MVVSVRRVVLTDFGALGSESEKYVECICVCEGVSE